MANTKTLFRPTGIHEMALIVRSGLKEFPPRLERQPIFYPVLTFEYAAQIAHDWNARDSPGHAGFVTQFEIESQYASRFEEHVVGSAQVHREFWVPAEELTEFNSHIVGIIRPIKAFYTDGYEGPESRTGLTGLDVPSQCLRLAAIGNDNRFDFLLTIETNWDVILLNFEWWAEHDGFSPTLRDAVLRDVLIGWQSLRERGSIPDCDPVGAELIPPA